jgi:hypothetical protein
VGGNGRRQSQNEHFDFANIKAVKNIFNRCDHVDDVDRALPTHAQIARKFD